MPYCNFGQPLQSQYCPTKEPCQVCLWCDESKAFYDPETKICIEKIKPICELGVPEPNVYCPDSMSNSQKIPCQICQSCDPSKAWLDPITKICQRFPFAVCQNGYTDVHYCPSKEKCQDCKSCRENAFLTYDFEMRQNLCVLKAKPICNFGMPVTDQLCDRDLPCERCQSCQPGYFLDKNLVCSQKIAATCKYGIAKADTFCETKEGCQKCDQCFTGAFLDYDQICKKNPRPSCRYGRPAAGFCPSRSSCIKCDKCRSSAWMDPNTSVCHPRVQAECKFGIAAKVLCPTNESCQKCVTCENEAWLNPQSKVCLPKALPRCDLGNAVSNGYLCPTSRSCQRCKDCFRHAFLNLFDMTCKLRRKARCHNGRPAQYCLTDRPCQRCVSCDNGYQLDPTNKFCKKSVMPQISSLQDTGPFGNKLPTILTTDNAGFDYDLETIRPFAKATCQFGLPSSEYCSTTKPCQICETCFPGAILDPKTKLCKKMGL